MIREQIRHEDSLVNHRITWLLISQAFVFAAFTSVALQQNQVLNIPKENIPLLLFFIALLGQALNISSFAGILAAFRSLRILREKWYNTVEDQTKDRYPPITYHQ
jgi:hypothetical protein